MKRLLLGVGAAAVLAGPVLGQAPASRPSFEIAAIQPSTRPTPGMRGGVLRGNRYEIRNPHMVDLIRTAYNVQPDKITGGPSWLEWNRFDIGAGPGRHGAGSAAGDVENAAGRAIHSCPAWRSLRLRVSR